MFDTVWPTLPTAFRNELILQCVRHLKQTPDEYEAFALVVASAIKARPQSVKSQWRIADLFGTTRALALNPKAGAPFFAVTYMGVRKDELAALYDALGVTHAELEVAESSAVTNPPTAAQFASVLEKGLDGVTGESVRCMLAIIAETGIDAWQAPAREALVRSSKSTS